MLFKNMLILQMMQQIPQNYKQCALANFPSSLEFLIFLVKQLLRLLVFFEFFWRQKNYRDYY